MDVLNRSLMIIKQAPAWVVLRIMGVERTYVQVEHQPLDFWPNEICNAKQYEMYKALLDFRVENGYYPTYAELVENTGHAIATVQKRLQELVKLGLIEYDGGRMIKIKGETYIPPYPYLYLKEKGIEHRKPE